MQNAVVGVRAGKEKCPPREFLGGHVDCRALPDTHTPTTTSSPTRVGRPAGPELQGPSRMTKTAATRMQPTPPAVMRGASLRHPLTATKTPTLPEQRERGAPQKRDLEVGGKSRQKWEALGDESSGQLQIPGVPWHQTSAKCPCPRPGLCSLYPGLGAWVRFWPPPSCSRLCLPLSLAMYPLY